jgi:hypothetical protein
MSCDVFPPSRVPALDLYPFLWTKGPRSALLEERLGTVRLEPQVL